MIAYVSSFTTSMVANFQETSVPVMHNIAAFITFVTGLVYCWGQVLFSYAMKPRMVTITITHLRTILCCFATFFFVANLSVQIAEPFVNLPANYTTTPKPPDYQVTRISSDSPYFVNHIVVTLAEWLMAICFEVFVITFAIELRHAYAHGPKLDIKSTAAIVNAHNHRQTGVDNVKVSYLNADSKHTSA